MQSALLPFTLKKLNASCVFFEDLYRTPFQDVTGLFKASVAPVTCVRHVTIPAYMKLKVT
jgi:hypothetical protein